MQDLLLPQLDEPGEESPRDLPPATSHQPSAADPYARIAAALAKIRTDLPDERDAGGEGDGDGNSGNAGGARRGSG